MDVVVRTRVIDSPHDATATPIGSEFILPEQFFGNIVQSGSRSAEDNSELRLMLAVLEDAVFIYQKPALGQSKAGRKRRAFWEVEEWIGSNDLSWPYSFLNICRALSIDPDYLREGLRRWRRTYQNAPRIQRLRRIAGRRTQVTEVRSRRGRQAV